MQECYIFDLDGTLTDCTHRLHFINADIGLSNKLPYYISDSTIVYSSSTKYNAFLDKEKDWNSFYMACGGDLPNYHIIEILKALRDKNYLIALLTGREEICRRLTVDWLEKFEIKYDYLYMRRPKDYRPDSTLKKGWVESLQRRDIKILGAFEDRTSNIKMFRQIGIPAFQVAEGDY